MKQLFEPVTLNHLSLKNRFVRSATYEKMATEEGHLTERLMKVYEDLAAGGVGLIISSYAYVRVDGLANEKMLGIYDDSFIEEYKELTKRVHQYDTKIIMQLVYGGSQTKYKVEEREMFGPSAVAHAITEVVPCEMSVDDIFELVQDFKEAARRCKQAGFDGVQIHGAHGYLLSQFLDPRHNQRVDEYGGSIENRARIIFEVYEAIRSEVGSNYHVGIKINCSDNCSGGLEEVDSLWVCEQLDAMGIDSIEVSGGQFRSFKGESFFDEFAINLAEKVKCDVMLVGGNKKFSTMTKLLNNSQISCFSMSRALLCEPDLVHKFEMDESYVARCVNCNRCLANGKLCILHR